MKVKDIPIARIHVAKNVRSETDEELGELMQSIQEHGLLQPILVRHRRDADYEVVAGHRRLAAFKASGESHIACVIDDEITEADRTVIQLTENCQRKQMTPFEYVAVFEALRKADRSMTRPRIAQLIGKSKSWIAHQYDAVNLAGSLVGNGAAASSELKSLTAGQIIARAQKHGLGRGGQRQVRDFISVACVNSTTINVRCQDSVTTGRVLEAIDQLRLQLRAESEELDGAQAQKRGRKRA